MKKNFEIARKELRKQINLLLESKAYQCEMKDDSVSELVHIVFSLEELESFLKICENYE